MTRAAAPDAQPEPSAQAPGSRRRLRVEVHCADILEIEADVYAVGHYMGVEPQFAELALDRAVSGLREADVDRQDRLVITGLTRRGVIKGNLGDVHFVPWVRDAGSEARSSSKSAAVAVCGMGRTGSFGQRQAQQLAESLIHAVGSLPHAKTLCTVLIGSGVGNVPTEEALEALIQGLIKADPGRVPQGALARLIIVDRNYAGARRAMRALQALHARGADSGALLRWPEWLELEPRLLVGAGARVGTELALALALAAFARACSGRGSPGADARRIIGSIRLGEHLRDEGLADRFEAQLYDELARLHEAQRDVDPLEAAERLSIRHELRPRPGAACAPTRFSFARQDSGIVVACLSDAAVIPERPTAIDPGLVDEAVAGMIDPDSAQVDELGRMLNRLLLPRDFRETLRDAAGALVFELDREMARIHWEMMACDLEGEGRDKAIALVRPVARQLRTAYSAPPAAEAPAGGPLRALVVGDPGDPDAGFSLPGARSEAFRVAEILEDLGVEVTLMLGAPGSQAEWFRGRHVSHASRLNVLRELLRGGFDLLHYAGHGDFDADDPRQRSGWLFQGGLLGARELERVDLAPRLVVANACLSGQLSRRQAGPSSSPCGDAQLLPGLADEFFRRGVRNYVGTAWEIDDRGAALFADRLYRALLGDGRPLGEALMEARAELHRHEDEYGALWAAYQHYGSPGFQLRAKAAAARQPRRRRAGP